MTKKQKEIFEVLFRGGHIVKVRPGLYTARVANGSPIRRGNDTTMFKVFKYCKKIMKLNSPMWILNKKEVLKLRANHWVKKRYKQVRDQLLIEQTTDATLEVLQSYPVTVGFTCQPCDPMHVTKFTNNTN